MNIYKTCPDVYNERFRLRLVTQEDCEDLLKVYSDVKAVPLFNGDNCNGDDFYYEKIRQQILRLNPTAEEKIIRKFIKG